jgi:chemotaxis protein histidine kinase CheA
MQKHEVPQQKMEELLRCLKKQELWEVCKERPECTAKDVIVSALIHSQLQLADLSKEQLKAICEKQGLAQTGNKEDLVSRLLAGQQPGQQDKPPAKQAKAAAKQEQAAARKEEAPATQAAKPAKQDKAAAPKEQAPPAKQAKAEAKQEPRAQQKKAPSKQCKAPAMTAAPRAPGAPVVSGIGRSSASCYLHLAQPAALAKRPRPSNARGGLWLHLAQRRASSEHNCHGICSQASAACSRSLQVV